MNNSTYAEVFNRVWISAEDMRAEIVRLSLCLEAETEKVATRDAELKRMKSIAKDALMDLETLDDGTPRFFAVWELDRAYGGPEEGGWWYDTRVLIHSERISPNSAPEDIEKLREALATEYSDPYARPVGSVLYAGGQIGVSLESVPPADFEPRERPCYE